MRIVQYKRSGTITYGNYAILDIGTDFEGSKKYVGKKVSYKTSAGKEIRGTIVRPHGRKGRVIARFTRGLPGQALSSPVGLVK